MDDDLLARRSPPNWTLPLLVALTTVVAFSPVLQNGFVDFDDPQNFLENPHFRGLGPAQIKWVFTAFHMGHYLPLTWMTLGFDYLLWGMDSRGYHLTNLILHLASAVTFYFIALRLLRVALASDIPRGDLRLRMGAAFAASLFAVHPLRVESVAWVTERRDVLSGLFYLLAILAYLRFCERLPGRAGERARWYWVSVGAFFFAVLSKSITMSLPVVLLALDGYPLRRLGGPPSGWLERPMRRVWIEKIPFGILAAAAGVMAVIGLHHVGNVASLRALGLVERIAVSCYGLAFYLWKTVVPVHLAPFYQLRAPVAWMTWPFLLSGGLVVAISAAAIHRRRRWPALAVAWVTYVVTLLPVLGIVQNGPQIAADRYSYLACLSWAVLAGGGLAWASALETGRHLRALVAAGASAIVVILAVLTWHQVQIWRDSVTLWTHASSVDHGPSVAKNLLVALLAKGDVPQAHAHFKRMIARVRGQERIRWFFNMAMLLQVNGDLEGAAKYYREAIALNPNNEEAWNNLGAVYATRGETSRALEAFLRAVRINSGYAVACENARRAAEIVGVTDAVLEDCGDK